MREITNQNVGEMEGVLLKERILTTMKYEVNSPSHRVNTCFSLNGHGVDWAAARLASITPDHESIEGCDEIQARTNGDSGSQEPVAVESSLQLILNSNNGQLTFSEPIEVETLQLFDITGRPLQTQVVVSGNVVNLPSLTPGIYFLQDKESGTSFRFFTH